MFATIFAFIFNQISFLIQLKLLFHSIKGDSWEHSVRYVGLDSLRQSQGSCLLEGILVQASRDIDVPGLGKAHDCLEEESTRQPSLLCIPAIEGTTSTALRVYPFSAQRAQPLLFYGSRVGAELQELA